jgi:hypothetical protein
VAENKEAIVSAVNAQRVVTPTNPLLINSAVGNYGDVVIEGGFIQVKVPAPGVTLTSLTKKS